jgi:hypothetical protein
MQLRDTPAAPGFVRPPIGLLCLTAVVAALFAFVVFPPLVGPLQVHYMRADGYLEMAENLLEGKGFIIGREPRLYDGSMRREPLYPLVLAASMLVPKFPVSMVFLHIGIFIVTVSLAFVVFKRYAARSDLALRAAATFALFPFSYWYIAKPTPENLSPVLLLASLWCFHRYLTSQRWADAAVWAAACALCTLTKSNLVLLFPIGCLVGLCGRESRGALSRHMVTAGVVFVVFLSPWGWRNYRLSGKPVWGTSLGGPAFFIGNLNSTWQTVQDAETGLRGEEAVGREWKARYLALRAEGKNAAPAVLEGRVDETFAAEVVPWVLTHKAAFIRKSAIGVATMWFITSDWKKTAVLFLFQAPLILLAGRGIWRAWKHGSLGVFEQHMLAIVGIVYVSTAIISPDARYTHVMLPLVAYFVALGLCLPGGGPRPDADISERRAAWITRELTTSRS